MGACIPQKLTLEQICERRHHRTSQNTVLTDGRVDSWKPQKKLVNVPASI